MQKVKHHLQSVSNGLGAPSILLVIMAIRGEIPATVCITADTGWENDRLWNTGRRSTAREYYDEVVVPLCAGSKVTPYFVRKVDENKNPMPSLRDLLVMGALSNGKPFGVPMFGSRGGRAMQSCTDKMKIGALRQQARRLDASTNCNAQGIHASEADRRVKGRFLRMDGEWSIYQTTVIVKDPETGAKTHKDIKWQTHYYPFVDRRMKREDIYRAVEKEGVPYIISSECDLCPHKDLARWERSSPQTIEDGAAIEKLFDGQYFFTPERIPLKEAITLMQSKKKKQLESDIDFGCGNAECGV